MMVQNLSVSICHLLEKKIEISAITCSEIICKLDARRFAFFGNYEFCCFILNLLQRSKLTQQCNSSLFMPVFVIAGRVDTVQVISLSS